MNTKQVLIPQKEPMDTDKRLKMDISLAGKLLIAMPSLNDPNFDHAVVLVCRHDEQHALGLVLNQPMERVNFKRLVDDLDIDLESEHDPKGQLANSLIYRGGPVETERGFVLHSLDYALSDGTLKVNAAKGEFGLTATRDILVDMAKARGPEKAIVTLGYSGWSAGQLEQELTQNAWLIAPASPELVFCRDTQKLWSKALQSIGIRSENLSGLTGTA